MRNFGDDIFGRSSINDMVNNEGNYSGDYAVNSGTGYNDIFKEIGDHDIPEFKKLENELRNITEEKKKTTILGLINFPKFNDDKDKSIIRCPVYRCFKPLNGVQALNSHIARNHKELFEQDIKIGHNGEIKCPSWVLDHVLR